MTLLTSGNEPKLAELFAHAELKRRGCASLLADWMTSIENPQLRGRFDAGRVSDFRATFWHHTAFIWSGLAGLTLWRHIGGR